MSALQDSAGNGMNYFETVFGFGQITMGDQLWQGWEHPFYAPAPLLSEQTEVDGTIVYAWVEPGGKWHWFNEWFSFLEGVYTPLVG